MKDVNYYLNEQTKSNDDLLDDYTKAFLSISNNYSSDFFKNLHKNYKATTTLSKLINNLVKNNVINPIAGSHYNGGFYTSYEIKLTDGSIHYPIKSMSSYDKDSFIWDLMLKPCFKDKKGKEYFFLQNSQYKYSLYKKSFPEIYKLEFFDRIEFRNTLGKLNREDGPAIEYTNGAKAWFSKGKRHREDGPAIEYPNGVKGWWINGRQYTENQFTEQKLLKITRL
jgi:hypothetical protein